MAASAVSVNREGSSMVYIEETDSDLIEGIDYRIKEHQEAQQARTSNYCNVSCIYKRASAHRRRKGLKCGTKQCHWGPTKYCIDHT